MLKISLIGVGSVCFGASTIADLLYYKEKLHGATLALVDIDPEKQELMMFLADKMNREAGEPFHIIGSCDRREVIAGSKFVVTSPAILREELWKKDWDIIHGAGIRQTYGENGGPGSLSHTLRNIPMLADICRDVEELAPDAWMINFTNPEARICTYFDRYTSLKFVGLCHQIYEGYRCVSKLLSIPQEELDIKAAGINHFTWMYDIRRKGTAEDLYPAFIRAVDAMPPSFEPISRQLYHTYGMFPTAGDHHLAEFLSFAWEKQGLAGRDFASTVDDKVQALAWLRGVKEGTRAIEEKVHGKSGKAIADIIAAMETGNNSYQVSVDIRNNGCIPNLPHDAVVEVPGIVSSDGVHGLAMPPLPEGIACMIRQQMTVQQLSVEAAVTGSRKTALQALLLDPVVDSFDTAQTVLEQLLEAHREYISPKFFNGKS